MATTGYTSETLAHFVGFRHPLDQEANYQLLLTIIRSGWVSHPPHGPGWGAIHFKRDLTQSLASGKLIEPSVTCYADIPHEHLNIHLTKYGLFGLSFPRSQLVKYGARPVTYFPMSATDQGSPYGQSTLRDIEAVYRSFVRGVVDEINCSLKPRVMGREPDTAADAIVEVTHTLERDFLAFLKPFEADLAVETFDNYYLEREWRKYGNMQVSSSTVTLVYVAETFVDRFKNDVPEFSNRVRGLELSRANARTRCGVCQTPLPTDSKEICGRCGAARKHHLESVTDRVSISDRIL